MAKAEIQPGVCGFTTLVDANATGEDTVALTITTQCELVRRLAQTLPENAIIPGKATTSPNSDWNDCVILDAMQVIATGYVASTSHCAGLHAACPVPVGIVKAVEVAAGLALPKDVCIKVSRE
jgi:hypothetical protein